MSDIWSREDELQKQIDILAEQIVDLNGQWLDRKDEMMTIKKESSVVNNFFSNYPWHFDYYLSNIINQGVTIYLETKLHRDSVLAKIADERIPGLSNYDKPLVEVPFSLHGDLDICRIFVDDNKLDSLKAVANQFHLEVDYSRYDALKQHFRDLRLL